MRRIKPKRYIAEELREKIEQRQATAEPTRLGDKIGSVLESVGVTPERWREAKAAIGLPATCNCDARKAWLNALDAKLGLAEKLGTVAGLLGWK
jgi:hypothetical protein